MTAKTQNNLQIPDSGDNHITKALTEIKGAIQDLPLSFLTETIRREIGLEEATTAAVSAQMDASEAIDRLEAECQLANQRAISELQQLGMRISNILAYLLGDPNDKPIFLDHPDTQYFSEHDKSVIDSRAIIRKEITNLLKFKSDILRDKLNQEVQEPKKIHPIYHPARLSQITGLQHVQRHEEEGPEQELSNRITLATALFQHAVGRRIAQERQSATYRVAINSTNWPVSISCFAEKREDQHNNYFSMLPVGNNLEFQSLKRIAGQRGRDFSPVTSTGFTQLIFMQLRQTREKALRMNKSHLEWYREIELATTKGRRKKKKITNGKPSIPDPNDYTGRESLDDRWDRMAILLPEFSKETLNAWVNAAAAYCEAKCQGDWEMFKCIPWIKNRLEVKQQSIETCLRELLKAGLTKLLKSPERLSQP